MSHDERRKPVPSRAPPPPASSPGAASPASSIPPPRGSAPGTTIPPPRPSSSTAIAVADIENAIRGATNVVRQCLRPAVGERVHLLTFKAGGLARLLERAIADENAPLVRVPLDALDRDETVDGFKAALVPLLQGASAVVFIAPARPPQTLSLAVATVAESMGARLLYLLQVDDKLLAQSVRADPELLATVNERMVQALAAPSVVRVTSESGTDLEIQLSLHHPLRLSSGRPERGASENLPAGYVYTHPARVNGLVVVDRAIFGPKGDVDRATLRRAPVRVRFQSGRVVDHDAVEPAVRSTVDNYLASHTHAGRVGLVVFPTNYLARSEIGSDRQDMLLPGVNLSLGFADQAHTKAPYEAAVQLVLLGRKQTIEVDGRRLVDAGRMEKRLVEGIDPFR
ncbi:MAG: hypothetical protein U0414_33100 [Polyangiaceae bacterium]